MRRPTPRVHSAGSPVRYYMLDSVAWRCAARFQVIYLTYEISSEDAQLRMWGRFIVLIAVGFGSGRPADAPRASCFELVCADVWGIGFLFVCIVRSSQEKRIGLLILRPIARLLGIC